MNTLMLLLLSASIVAPTPAGVSRMWPTPEGLRVPHEEPYKGPIDLRTLMGNTGRCSDAIDCAGISMSFCHDFGGVAVQTWAQGQGEWSCQIRCNGSRPGESRKAFGIQPCDPPNDNEPPPDESEPPAEGEPCTPYDPEFVGPVDPPMCEPPPCPDGVMCT